jgi:hypothetical protein
MVNIYKPNDSIEFRGIDFEFNYDYSPAERQTHEYPGCGEEWEIYNICINGVDAEYLIEDMREEFDRAVITYFENKD